MCVAHAVRSGECQISAVAHAVMSPGALFGLDVAVEIMCRRNVRWQAIGTGDDALLFDGVQCEIICVALDDGMLIDPLI